MVTPCTTVKFEILVGVILLSLELNSLMLNAVGEILTVVLSIKVTYTIPLVIVTFPLRVIVTVSPLYVSPETIPVILISSNKGVLLNTFALNSNEVVDCVNVIDSRLVQKAKASVSMDVTDPGMPTDVRFSQELKAFVGISVKRLSLCTMVKLAIVRFVILVF